MRINDDGRTVAAMDVLAPGIGEIIGGSQRERNAWTSSTRAWQFGGTRSTTAGTAISAATASVPHAGFGPGFRAPGGLRLRTGYNIRDAIAYPRAPGSAGVLSGGSDLVLFFALLAFAIAIAGATAFVIFCCLAGAYPRPPSADHRAAGRRRVPETACAVVVAARRPPRHRIATCPGWPRPSRVSLLVIPAASRWAASSGSSGAGIVSERREQRQLVAGHPWPHRSGPPARKAGPAPPRSSTATAPPLPLRQHGHCPRGAGMDTEFVEFDGLDGGRCAERGFSLGEYRRRPHSTTTHCAG